MTLTSGRRRFSEVVFFYFRVCFGLDKQVLSIVVILEIGDKNEENSCERHTSTRNVFLSYRIFPPGVTKNGCFKFLEVQKGIEQINERKIHSR